MNAEIDITSVVIKTPRLILREWRSTDLNDLFAYASNPEVGPMAGWSPHKNIEESLMILNRFIAGKDTFAIVDKKSGKVIGSLGIDRYGCEDRFTEFLSYKGRELGYVLAKDHWGKGLMTEALSEVIDYLFNRLDYDFLLCGHFDSNERSKRVQEKCGFKPYRKLTYEAPIGPKTGVLSLLINPKKDIVLEFSHPETLIYRR